MDTGGGFTSDLTHCCCCGVLIGFGTSIAAEMCGLASQSRAHMHHELQVVHVDDVALHMHNFILQL